jgi:endonuclease-8
MRHCFRAKIHPESLLGKIPSKKKKALIGELIEYSKLFLKWRRENMLSRHWQAYKKKICPRDLVAFKVAVLGKTKRRTFFCRACQKIYK